MSGVENISSLKVLCEKGFEIKTAYANKGMHFVLLQKGSDVALASTDSVNVEFGNDVFYESYDVRMLTEKPS